MSDWEYDQYTGADWNKELEIQSENGDGWLLLQPNGTMEIMVASTGCYDCSSINEYRRGRLTLDQAIEIQVYLTEVIAYLTVVERLQGESDAGAIP